MRGFAVRSFAVAALAVVTLVASSASGALVLPPNTGGNTNRFGDFDVYSLPFLNNLFGGGFSVPSSPGQIADDVVLMTGTNNGPTNNNPADMDNAYRTPDGNGSPPNFDTKDVADPTGDVFTGDQGTTWDARVSALRSFLATGGGDLVFLFNLNETNTGGLPGQDLLAWAKVSLIDEQNALNNKMYFVSAADDPLTVPDEHAAGLTASQNLGAPNEAGAGTSPPLDPQWATAHGQITVDANTGAFLHFGPPNGLEGVPTALINQNLGANDVAFALYNEELSNFVKDPASIYDLIQIEIVLSRISNGYEQAFIKADTVISRIPPGVIPEPASAMVWSLLGLVAYTKGSRHRPAA